jgi:zinc D-Ala-D-Ala carboxypeptidase
MNLTAHFTLEELIHSDTAVRHGIDNTPDQEVIENLHKLAEGLEDVRKLLCYPIFVSSGYRCLELNTLLKSKPTSAHVRGLAADFIVPAYGSVEKVMEAIVNSDIQYDQCIIEFGRWIHLSFAPEMRRNNLIIDKEGTRLYDN